MDGSPDDAAMLRATGAASPDLPGAGSVAGGRLTPVWSQHRLGHVQNGQLILYPQQIGPGLPGLARASPPPAPEPLEDGAEEVVVLSTSDASGLVLYNRERKSLTLHSSDAGPHPLAGFENAFCPLCKQRRFNPASSAVRNFTADGYFALLGSTTAPSGVESVGSDGESSSAPQPPKAAGLRPDFLNSGYYARFFQEERKIGSGGFGAVFLARHMLHGISLGQYAVKKVPVGDNHAWFVKVLTEVRALEALHHPNVVGYKHSWLENSRTADFGPEVPCLFILMDYANAGNLADYVQAKGKPGRRAFLEESEIWSLFIDICLGLRHLHHSSIIHRDLKAQNLLLHTTVDPVCNTKQTHAMISDFGQCQTVDSIRNTLKRTGNTGTVEYVAPELLVTDDRGEYRTDYDDKSDVWSLGVILYLLCFGQLPFQSPDSDELVRLIVRAAPAPPERPQRCEALLELVGRMLRREPAARPSVDLILKHPEVEKQMKRLKREELYPTAPPRPSASPLGPAGPVALRRPAPAGLPPLHPSSLGASPPPAAAAPAAPSSSASSSAPIVADGGRALSLRRSPLAPLPLPPASPPSRPVASSPASRSPSSSPPRAALRPDPAAAADPSASTPSALRLLPPLPPPATSAPSSPLGPSSSRRRTAPVVEDRPTVVGGVQIRRIPSDSGIASDAATRRRLEIADEGEGEEPMALDLGRRAAPDRSAAVRRRSSSPEGRLLKRPRGEVGSPPLGPPLGWQALHGLLLLIQVAMCVEPCPAGPQPLRLYPTAALAALSVALAASPRCAPRAARRGASGGRNAARGVAVALAQFAWNGAAAGLGRACGGGGAGPGVAAAAALFAASAALHLMPALLAPPAGPRPAALPAPPPPSAARGSGKSGP